MTQRLSFDRGRLTFGYLRAVCRMLHGTPSYQHRMLTIKLSQPGNEQWTLIKNIVEDVTSRLTDIPHGRWTDPPHKLRRQIDRLVWEALFSA